MWYSPLTTVAAASEPVTLAEAKEQCRVTAVDSNDDVQRILLAAQSHVESYTGTRLAAQTVEIKCDSFQDFALLPLAPVNSVSAITYVDADGATQTLATSVYEVRADGLRCTIVRKFQQVWPVIRDGSRITVTASVGYAAIPEEVRLAILQLVAHWFDNRQAVAPGTMSIVEMTVDALLTNHRAPA